MESYKQMNTVLIDDLKTQKIELLEYKNAAQARLPEATAVREHG